MGVRGVKNSFLKDRADVGLHSTPLIDSSHFLKMLFQNIAAVLALGLGAQATQTFRNTGTTSGWDYINTEHSGTVQQVSNVV